MKKHGILKSNISKVLADCGLLIPRGVNKIDLSLKIGNPKFINVLEEVLKDLEIEKVYLAEGIKNNNSPIMNKYQL